MELETLKPPPALVERASDWLNPILVKETRQALKSRQFVATFFLMLTASLLISVFGVVILGTSIAYQEMGRQFFAAYYIVLAFTIFVVVPFTAFRSLLSERDLHTWEVLSITTLKPRQIVWGKLTSAIVQMFIYYSAITPFIAFANLLKGIDVPTIAFMLVASLLVSMALSLLALALSTMGSQRHWQIFLTLTTLGALLTVLGWSIGIAFAAVNERLPFDEAGFWWIVAIVLSYVAAFCVLFLQIAVAQLTFDADNRSTGIRVTASVLFWMTLGWVTVPILFSGTWGLPATPVPEEFLIAVTIVTGIHWLLFGLFAVTESDVLSRRVRRDLQRFGGLRAVIAPFLPGGGRGLIYLLAHVAALTAFMILVAGSGGRSYENVVKFAIGLACYLVIYLGIGAALGRAARAVSGDFRPAHARVLTVLLVAVGSILPLTFNFIDSVRASQDAVLFVTDPFQTLRSLSNDDPASNLLLVILMVAALLSVAINLRAMLGGMMDVARPYVPHAPATPRIADQVVLS